MTKKPLPPVERFEQALQGLDPYWPISNSGDQYVTRCPVHGGRDDDSMSFSAGEDGRLLVCCHSRNCSYEDIMRAVGLEISDGFVKDPPQRKRSRTKKAISRARSHATTTPREKGTMTTLPKSKGEAKPLARGRSVFYDYQNEDGEIVIRVVKTPRLDQNGNQVQKDIFQQRKVAEGFANTLKAGWFEPDGMNRYKRVAGPDEKRPSSDAFLESNPAPRPLYHLPEVKKALTQKETIIVLEGEKDVDAARKLGLYATTNPGGAGKWSPEHTTGLEGASSVVIIPDNDHAGHVHAQAVAKALAGTVDELRIVELPGLGEKEDFSDWVDCGGDARQLVGLIDQTPLYEQNEDDVYVMLPSVPEKLKKPLAIVDGRSYLYSRVPVANTKSSMTAEIVIDEDSKLFSDVALKGAAKLADLGFEIEIPSDINPRRFISPSGVDRLVSKDEVDLGEVFERIGESVRAFVDLGHSIGPEATMVKLVALMVMATYFLDAFPRIGYGWIQGPLGSGKSKLMGVMTRLAYMGEFVTASSTYATLRDLASVGAMIGIDDCGDLGDPKWKPDIRALLLSGISRDAETTLKAPSGPREWKTVWVPAIGFWFFTAMVAPDPVLASRLIQIPLVPTNNAVKANLDPSMIEHWPHGPASIRDDLWILGVRYLAAVRMAYDGMKSRSLVGRPFDAWKPILAVAFLLETVDPSRFSGLEEEIHALAVDYQESRRELEQEDNRHIFVKALWSLCPPIGAKQKNAQPKWLDKEWSVSASEVAEKISAIAKREGLHPSDSEEDFLSAVKVGLLLRDYRFPSAQRTNRSRFRKVSARRVLELADSLGLQLPHDPRRGANTSGKYNVSNAQPRQRVSGDSQ